MNDEIVDMFGKTIEEIKEICTVNPIQLTPLELACKKDDAHRVRKLLRSKKHADRERGDDALVIASELGHVACVQEFVNAPGFDAGERWLDALESACVYGQDGCVRAILERPDCNVNKQKAEGEMEGCTVLMLACVTDREGCVRKLLDRPDCDVNKESSGATTALMLACESGHEGCARALLERPDCVVNRENHKGMTALMLACKVGQEGCARALLERPDCDVNRENHKGMTALMLACHKGNERDRFLFKLSTEEIEMYEKDIIEESIEEYTASSMARRREGCVRKLLERPECDVNRESKGGCTALMLACKANHEGCARALLERLECDVNKEDHKGMTALMLAHLYGHESCERAMTQQRGQEISSAEKRENMNTICVPRMHACNFCGRQAFGMKKCAGCSTARYCNRDCQERDWNSHKTICNR